jgi:hypothetical protein
MFNVAGILLTAKLGQPRTASSHGGVISRKGTHDTATASSECCQNYWWCILFQSANAKISCFDLPVSQTLCQRLCLMLSKSWAHGCTSTPESTRLGVTQKSTRPSHYRAATGLALCNVVVGRWVSPKTQVTQVAGCHTPRMTSSGTVLGRQSRWDVNISHGAPSAATSDMPMICIP